MSGLQPGDARVDDAPAELSAPAAPAPAVSQPVMPPAETRGVPPAGDSAEPDLSEDGLKREAEARAAAEGKTAPEAPAAEAKPDDAPPAEEPKSEEPAPPADARAEDRPGKLAVQLRNRERKLVEQQQAFARQRAEFDSSMKAERARFEQERGEFRSVHEQTVQIINALRSDPYSVLFQMGWTPEQLGERLANGNKPTMTEGETRVSREVAELRQMLEAERKASREEIRQIKQAREKERYDAAIAQERASFTGQAKGGSAKFPLASALADEDPTDLWDRAWSIATDNAQRGVNLSNEEILDKIEEQLGKYARVATKARPGKTSAPAVATATSRSTPSASARSPQVQTGSRNQPAPTLTSEAAGERSIDLETMDLLALENSPGGEDKLRELTMAAIDRAKSNGVPARR